MAGTYLDMPSRKMPWDQDGTVVFGNWVADGGGSMGRGEFPEGSALVEMTLADKKLVNGDTDAEYGGLTGPGNSPAILWALMFPEKREIDGYYWNASSTDPITTKMLSKSVDTTNVRDGVWTALGSEVLEATATTKPDYRDNYESAAESNITGIFSQISIDTGISNEWTYLETLNLYGTITPGQDIDKLIFLDSENGDLEFTKPLDYGDIGQGSASIRKIKIKNNSTTRTASDVTVTAEWLVTGTGMFTYSTDGVNDETSLALSSLGPGGTTSAYIHLAISDSHTVDVYEIRTVVEATTWS